MDPDFDFDHIFSHHPPTPEQVIQYQLIRDAAKEFAQVVIDNTPNSADQFTAIRQIREAMMSANSAIALEGRLFK